MMLTAFGKKMHLIGFRETLDSIFSRLTTTYNIECHCVYSTQIFFNIEGKTIFYYLHFTKKIKNQRLSQHCPNVFNEEFI